MDPQTLKAPHEWRLRSPTVSTWSCTSSAWDAPSVYTGSETEFLDPEFRDWLREGAKSDARAKLEEPAQRIKEMGGEVAKTHAAVGRPDAEIVHIAEELGAGLIVVGQSGTRTAKARLDG